MFNLIGLVSALTGHYGKAAAFFAFDFLEDRKKSNQPQQQQRKFIPLTKEQHRDLEYKYRRDLDANLYGPF